MTINRCVVHDRELPPTSPSPGHLPGLRNNTDSLVFPTEAQLHVAALAGSHARLLVHDKRFLTDASTPCDFKNEKHCTILL